MAQGVPFEGNYSAWLEKKAALLAANKKVPELRAREFRLEYGSSFI